MQEAFPMSVKDDFGYTLTGATAAGDAHYETALRRLQCYISNPVASIDEALQTSPGFLMAHGLKAYLHLLGTEPNALPVARECCGAAKQLPADARASGHVQAVGQLVAGHRHAAGRTLEDISIVYPCAPSPCRRGIKSTSLPGYPHAARPHCARVWEHSKNSRIGEVVWRRLFG